jgi:hypothetical protein
MATDVATVYNVLSYRLWQFILNEMCGYAWINNTVKYDLRLDESKQKCHQNYYYTPKFEKYTFCMIGTNKKY